MNKVSASHNQLQQPILKKTLTPANQQDMKDPWLTVDHNDIYVIKKESISRAFDQIIQRLRKERNYNAAQALKRKNPFITPTDEEDLRNDAQETKKEFSDIKELFSLYSRSKTLNYIKQESNKEKINRAIEQIKQDTLTSFKDADVGKYFLIDMIKTNQLIQAQQQQQKAADSHHHQQHSGQHTGSVTRSRTNLNNQHHTDANASGSNTSQQHNRHTQPQGPQPHPQGLIHSQQKHGHQSQSQQQAAQSNPGGSPSHLAFTNLPSIYDSTMPTQPKQSPQPTSSGQHVETRKSGSKGSHSNRKVSPNSAAGVSAQEQSPLQAGTLLPAAQQLTQNESKKTQQHQQPKSQLPSQMPKPSYQPFTITHTPSFPQKSEALNNSPSLASNPPNISQGEESVHQRQPAETLATEPATSEPAPGKPSN